MSQQDALRSQVPPLVLPFPTWTAAPPWFTPCDHCLCKDIAEDDWRMSSRTVPHRECCHCGKFYAVPSGGDAMKRTPLKRKSATKRRRVLPRCSNRQCHAIARIQGWCVRHAEMEADRLFSLWVRERDGRCMMLYLSLPCEGPLQAAHGEPRGNHATRYDPRNCHALCRAHHMLVDRGSKHALKAIWLGDVLGLAEYQDLLRAALMPVKRVSAIEDALAWLAPAKGKARASLHAAIADEVASAEVTK